MEMCKYKNQEEGFYIRKMKKKRKTQNRGTIFDILTYILVIKCKYIDRGINT